MCKLLTRSDVQNLAYNPDTGVLYRGGLPVGTVNRRGYLVVNMQGTVRLAHRLAWKLLTGDWPVGVIDHINRNKLDNRASNLRDVSQSVNVLNSQNSTRTKSGFAGVYLKRGRWLAKITINGKIHYLGAYNTPEAAHQQYLRAKQEAQNV